MNDLHSVWHFTPQLVAMAVLIVCSAFFSSSEAALFYLRADDRRVLSKGGPARRLAVQLLESPGRLLSSILFWNLVINMAYFALASIIGIRLKDAGLYTEARTFAVVAFLLIILLSEMLPKNMAVLRPRMVAASVSIPLALAIRLVDPVMPVLRLINLVSRRLLFPRLQPEPYLEIEDLERAITLGTEDAELAQQEQAVLRHIVALAQIQVEEVMRPRLQYQAFRPPVHLSDLRGRLTPSGYVLVTETDSDEIAAAIPLKHLSKIPAEQLEQHAEQVLYIPWSANVATTLEQLRNQERSVAAVINEFGETIGIVTIDDIIETVLHQEKGRSERLLQTASIASVGPEVWEVTGMTTLRRLRKQLRLQIPRTKSLTVAGLLQEQLQRLPQQGDVVEWSKIKFTVLQAPVRGRFAIRLERTHSKELKP
jgi:putative hemolysin